MSKAKQLSYVAWEYEGAFSIVFNERDRTLTTVAREMIMAGLRNSGFSIHSIRSRNDIASCANMKIEGIEGHPEYYEGVRMGKINTYFSYSFIDRIVSADKKVLWSR